MFPFSRHKTTVVTASLADTFFSVIDRTQATIQFKPDGTILAANANFLSALGYSLEEIVGKHHSIFIDKDYARTAEYRSFWSDLAAGKFFTDQFARVAKDGSVVWIQATYGPVLDENGKTVMVIKIATDITKRQRGIEKIADGLQHLSQGNLAYHVPHCEVPEIDALATAYNMAVEQLSATMSAVAQVSDVVRRKAGELGQGSSELSHRNEVQAATLEETAAAMEELTSTVGAAADGALDVEKTANRALITAKNGGKVAQDAIDAMSQIEKSSHRVSQVISVIDDIAFQTNLLALNAGIEAARAGDTGRGFAVVATEVRALALRSAESAAEINKLIRESSEFVKTGVALVVQAGDELKMIISGIEAIHSNIAGIANGATEQAITLREINIGVGQLDTMTQQNASMVEQSTAASQILVEHARDLASRVSQFQLGAPKKSASKPAPNRVETPVRGSALRVAS